MLTLTLTLILSLTVTLTFHSLLDAPCSLVRPFTMEQVLSVATVSPG